MSDNRFINIDVGRAGESLARLHEQVVNGKIRIELHGAGIDGASMIISKEELDALEKALEILSNTSGVKELTQALGRLAAFASESELAPAPIFELAQASQ